MKAAVSVKLRCAARTRRCAGWTVAEVLIASGIGAIFLVGVVLTSITSMRNFAGMYNYTDMSMDSRLAMDEIARNIRSSRGVNVSQTNILVLTNSSGTVSYTWTPSTATLICDVNSTSTTNSTTVLRNCNLWQVSIYQRTPTTNYDNTTNSGGATTKLLSMRWSCSRTIIGQRLNSETVQEARIVARNEN